MINYFHNINNKLSYAYRGGLPTTLVRILFYNMTIRDGSFSLFEYNMISHLVF